MRGDFEESKELCYFLNMIEYSKYSLLAVQYIRDNLETVTNSINGQLLDNHIYYDPSRHAYTLKDISWTDMQTPNDIVKTIVERSAVARVNNLKTQYERYAASIEMDNKSLGEDLINKCSSFRIVLPTGKVMHISDTVNYLRNALIHSNNPHSKDYQEYIDKIGNMDPEQLLMHITYLDENDSKKIYSYNHNHTLDFNAYVACIRFIDFLESEYQTMMIVYDNIRCNHIKSENDAVSMKYWLVPEYISK